MLYKKNSAAELDDKLFRKPTSEYRAAPFWSWNCVLEKDVLLHQIDVLEQMGFGGFHMHSRAGMATEYLSDEFMSLIRACCDKATQKNMLAWLYDEDRWPSGFAGGYVTKDKRFRQRFIVLTNSKREDALDKQTAYIEGKTYFVAAFDIKFNDKYELESYRRIGENDSAEHSKFYVYSEAAKYTPRFNLQTYSDTLSKEAVQKFIDITHERYKECVGDYFGKSVPAIFTDEPQFARKEVLGFADRFKEVRLPWTIDFDDTFKECCGDYITDFLPELYWEKPNGEISVHRYRYHDHLCNRFAQSYVDTIGKWCENNGIALTGHLMEEDSLFSQTSAVGDAMRSYRSFEIPGIDMLCDATNYLTAKQAQSAVHQFGREGLVSELYGVTNWDFDFRGHKFQGDWQAALGVTIRVPHLSWVSMKGSAKRDYPASINEQSPWYKDYGYVEDHFARLNTALTRGKPDVDIGIIHPIESYWLHWGPAESTANVRNQLERSFGNIVDWMLFGFHDFDLICEALLPSQVKNISDTLEVGCMKYKTVIVPGCETLRSTTLDILEKYSAAGGKLIFIGECPKYTDAKASSRAKALYEKSAVISFDKAKLDEILESDRKVSLKNPDGSHSSEYLYNLRRDANCSWLFIARGRKTVDKDSPDKNVLVRRDLTITLNGSFRPVVYDTLSGEIKETPFTRREGKTVIKHTFFNHDSLLLKLIPESGDIDFNIPAENHGKVTSREAVRGCVEYSLEEPNVLLLDYAQISVDGSPFDGSDEILRASRYCYGRVFADRPFYADAQPWVIPNEKAEHFIGVRFRFDSEIECKNVLLAFEEACEIDFNGKKADMTPCGTYVDHSIKTVRLPDIIKGENVLTVTVPFTPRCGLEAMYLLGDFGVKLKGTKASITSREKDIGFSSITNQGLPFYGGNITYKVKVDTPDCDLCVHASRYAGALVRVAFDGRDCGKIVYAPYKLDIKNVKSGKHEIEFTVCGNRYNTFGALHDCSHSRWAGSNMWSERDENWCYEYCVKDTGLLASPVIEIIEK